MIKASFRLILAALAATAALTACTKEITPGKADTDSASQAAEGTRTIAVSFAPQTKTTLEDGLQPKFAEGDSILLITNPQLQGASLDTQTVAVTIDPTTQNATISTRLFGDLKALYPARAVQNFPKVGYDILNTPVQSGKFEDANICVATIEENDTEAQFENKYALFIITPPEGTKSLTIKSLKKIGEEGQRSGSAVPINVVNAVIDSSKTITIPNEPEDGKYYVAITNANLSDLSFEAWFDDDGTTGSIKGIPTSKILSQATALGFDDLEDYNTVAAGTAYTIDSNNWHEYVTVANRKWATVNIGASTPQEAGEYFAWGGTTGYVQTLPDGDWYSFSPPDSTLLDGGFCWATCPHTQGEYTDSIKGVFTKYTADNSEFAFSGIADGKTILDLEDDAAYVKWGGAWRMPTRDEFSAMTIKVQGAFASGQHFGDDNDNTIFLPAAGRGENGNLVNNDDLRYWSSSLATPPDDVFSLFYDGSGEISCGEPSNRFYGYTIRAIIDEPLESGK